MYVCMCACVCVCGVCVVCGERLYNITMLFILCYHNMYLQKLSHTMLMWECAVVYNVYRSHVTISLFYHVLTSNDVPTMNKTIPMHDWCTVYMYGRV